jgi:eukaryotic-like serine/threonine-protein kinase
MFLRPALLFCVVLASLTLRATTMESGLAAEVDSATEPSPDIEWIVADEGERSGLSNPLFSDGLVIVGNDSGTLRAFKPATGADVWRFNQPGRIYHRPAADAERVYALAEFGALFAVDRKNGQLVWQRGSDVGFGAVAVDAESGLLFAAGNDGHVRAFKAANGEECWSANILDDAPPDPPGANGNRARFQGKPVRPNDAVCQGGAVFVSIFDQCRVVGFNIADGQKCFDYQAGGWVWGAPAVTEDSVFIGSQDDSLHCVDRATSVLIWSFKTKARIECTPTVDDWHVYFTSCDGGLYCLDRQSGAEVWRFEVDGPKKSIYSQPLLLDETVAFAAGDGKVYAVDRAIGAMRWSLVPVEGAELYSSLASDGRRLFVTSRPKQEKTGKAALVAIDPYFGQ